MVVYDRSRIFLKGLSSRILDVNVEVIVLYLAIVAAWSMALPANAAETRFFPVLQESEVHWFSYFEETAHKRTMTRANTDRLYPADLAGLAELARRYEKGLLEATTAMDSYHWRQAEILDLLADTYIRMGRPDMAFTAVQHQFFLTRIGKGLYDPGHAQLLGELADLALVTGDMRQAHDYEEALLNLQRRVLEDNDPELLNAYLRWADWHLHHFLDGAGSSTGAVNWQMDLMLSSHFFESDSFYRKAFEGLRKVSRLDGEIRESLLLGMKKWQILHLTAFRHKPRDGISRHEPAFSDSLHRPRMMPVTLHMANVSRVLRPVITEADLADSEKVRANAMQYMLLGDWQNGLGLYREARESYKGAWDLLANHQAGSQEKERLLTPGLPIPEPEEWLHFYSHHCDFRGHIDVVITLDHKGKVRHMEFQGPGLVQSGMAIRLERHIRKSVFRPRTPDAGKRGAEAVHLRYYYE